MCGLAGIVDSRGKPVSEELLQAMAAKLVHRGPNDEGFYRNGRARGLEEGGDKLGIRFPSAEHYRPGRRTSAHDQ